MLAIEFNLPFNQTVDLVAIADVLAAASVTAHVLLRKRDVRAAIGWIGLAWLSPISGPVLYFFLGINRVARRAARLTLPRVRREIQNGITLPMRDDPPLPDNILMIANVGDRLIGHPIAPGNAISLFHGGDEAYPAMLEAIRKARRSIALASYIFRADDVGNAFIEALRDAHGRGVEVRVMVDGVGSGYLVSPAVRELRRVGIAIGRFMHHWLPWRMPFLNMRNHKKLLIIDGAIGFTGGLNLGAENVRRLRPPHPVEDLHVRVDGPVVFQLMLTFAEDWKFTTGETLGGHSWWPEIARAGSVLARGIGSGPDEDIGKLESVLATAVAVARKRLRIVTPYFLPDQRLMSDIALAALRGVQVEIVLPERSDNRLLDWAMRGHFGFFAVPGVTVYLTSAPFDHSKLATVDGLWSAVGSANWDVRSLRLNFEFMLESYDAPTAMEIDHLIDGKLARARRLTLERLAARSLRIKFRDAGARLLLPYL